MTGKHSHWLAAKFWGEDRAEALFTGAPRASGDLIALSMDVGEDRLAAVLRAEGAAPRDVAQAIATYRAACVSVWQKLAAPDQKK